MTLTIDGTVEEFMREVFVKGIPLSARGKFAIETEAVADSPQPARLSVESWKQFVAEFSTKAVVLDDSREAIYAETMR